MCPGSHCDVEPGVVVEPAGFARPSTLTRSPAPLTGQRHGRRGGNGQETAAFTSSATFFSTTALHFCSAYDTGHRSPSSRLAVSWKPSVEYR